ncbi:unnamed protein product [Larinioides sclopetarius]|uniref:Uncharacterized protein n=1 Tax=Larinioides sclopetarius TaxID=280406 RepID=A0AAV2BNK3_9ARAC
MNHTEVPTLLNIAALKTAILFYNDFEVREFAKLVNFEDFNEEWKQLVHDKVSVLHIPSHLHKKVATIASRVGLYIRDKNIQFHEMHWEVSLMFGRHCQCLKGLLPSSYRWTTNACIDVPRTVQALVQDQRVDLAFRFILSCEYLLGIEAALLWNQMPKTMKSRFFERDLMYKLKGWINGLLKVSDIKLRCYICKRGVNHFSFEFIKRYMNFYNEDGLACRLEASTVEFLIARNMLGLCFICKRCVDKCVFEICTDSEFVNFVFRKIEEKWKCHPEFQEKIHHVSGIPSRWNLDVATRAKCLQQLDSDLGFTYQRISRQSVFENSVFSSFKMAGQIFMDSVNSLWFSIKERMFT